jgi:type IX secretion system substrate protein
MKDFTKNALILLCFLITGNLAFSQTPFWTEDFSGGQVPDTWGNEDPSGNNAFWTWCSNPATGQSGGCPGIFGSQTPFASATATNGFVTMDSDSLKQLPTNHVSQLTTDSIDCSGYGEVFLRFESQIGVYTVDADTGAIVRVSNDAGSTWTEFTAYPGLTTAVEFSANPEIVILDISSAAAGQADVRIQWQWEGNWEYMWNLDDISLLDGDPTPSTDLSLGDFFYPPASFAQPVSQIPSDTMGFFADVSNIGAALVTNVVLKAEVRELGGDVIWVDSLLIPAIDTGVVDSTFFLDNTFVPDQLVVGDYDIHYTLYSLDGEDGDMSNNSSTEIFLVTDNLWSKEAGTTTYYRPDGGPDDYVIGNVYTTSSNLVDEYKATEVTFAAAKNQADGNLAGDEVNIILMEIKESELGPGWDSFDDQMELFSNTALSLRSIGSHIFTTNSTTGVETEMLTDFELETPGVLLKPGNRYMLLASYENANNVIFHGFSEEISYFQISTILWSSADNQWFLGGFGPEPAAMLRMAIDLYSTVDNTPLPDNALKFYPNPAGSVLNVDLSLEKPTLANVTIAEMSGRVLYIDEIENASQESRQYDVSRYASGTYLIRVATEEGTSTKQFVVQH